MAFPTSSRRVGYFTVTFLCLICYWNSLKCELVHDDIFAIVENKDLRPETPIYSVFQNDFWGKPMKDNTSHKSYRPLCVLTFRLNYQFHGLQPLGYHLVNVLLHLTVTLFFLYFCEVNVFYDVKRSVAAGMLFAVHPVHTEAVTGVVGRADILACLFILLSLHIYERARTGDEENKVLNNNYKGKTKRSSPSGHFLTSIIFGCMAMLCKENGITVFGICIALEVIHRKQYLLSYVLERFKKSSAENLRFFRRIIMMVLAAGILLLFRLLMLHGQLPAFNEEDNPASFSPHLSTRFLTYLYLLSFNVWLLLAPVVLSYDWQIGSIPLVESLADVRNLHSLLLLVGLVILLKRAILSVENQNVILVGLSLLIIPFIPASNLFFRVGFVVAERILYIPSTGYCILVAQGLHIISRSTNQTPAAKTNVSQTRDSIAKTKRTSFEYLIDAVFIALIAAMVCRTISRNEVWKNRETLFRSGIDTLPQNAKAHYNYANFLKDTNKIQDAIHHYKTAVELYPKHASSHNNLATLLGDSEEAEFHFKQTLLYHPFHYRAMYNLASFYRKRGNNNKAIPLLEKSLSVNPQYSDAIQVYAETLYDVGEKEKGLKIFSDESLKSKNADFFNNFGVFLGRIGKSEDSVNAYKKSMQLNSSHIVAMINLGRQQKGMGRFLEAEKSYRKALKIERSASTLQLLGILLYQTKRLKEAELTFSEALKHDPKNPEYIRNYASTVFEQGQREAAINLLQDGLKAIPKSIVILNTLANFLMNVNRKEEALYIIESGLMTHPLEAELHFLKANVYREKGNMDLALQSYKEVAKIDPHHFGAHQNIGVIYHLKGFKIEAKSYYEKALALDPSNEVLKENIKKLMRSK